MRTLHLNKGGEDTTLLICILSDFLSKNPPFSLQNAVFSNCYFLPPYSVPAPLYFNSDTVPDLLVRINHGEWDAYNHSTVAVLDGQSGQALWSFGSVKTGMMSGLSLAATQPGADAAVFITMGTIQNNNNNSSTVQVVFETVAIVYVATKLRK